MPERNKVCPLIYSSLIKSTPISLDKLKLRCLCLKEECGFSYGGFCGISQIVRRLERKK